MRRDHGELFMRDLEPDFSGLFRSSLISYLSRTHSPTFTQSAIIDSRSFSHVRYKDMSDHDIDHSFLISITNKWWCIVNDQGRYTQGPTWKDHEHFSNACHGIWKLGTKPHDFAKRMWLSFGSHRFPEWSDERKFKNYFLARTGTARVEDVSDESYGLALEHYRAMQDPSSDPDSFRKAWDYRKGLSEVRIVLGIDQLPLLISHGIVNDRRLDSPPPSTKKDSVSLHDGPDVKDWSGKKDNFELYLDTNRRFTDDRHFLFRTVNQLAQESLRYLDTMSGISESIETTRSNRTEGLSTANDETSRSMSNVNNPTRELTRRQERKAVLHKAAEEHDWVTALAENYENTYLAGYLSLRKTVSLLSELARRLPEDLPVVPDNSGVSITRDHLDRSISLFQSCHQQAFENLRDVGLDGKKVEQECIRQLISTPSIDETRLSITEQLEICTTILNKAASTKPTTSFQNSIR
jgi:hypothetical protein